MDEEFETAQPQIEGLTTMELMVQVRHTGRMLSNFRIGLGGEARLKVDVDLGARCRGRRCTGGVSARSSGSGTSK